MITLQSFVKAKQDPGSTNKGSHHAGMKLFPCNHKITFVKSLYWDTAKAEQYFILVKWDHVITTLTPQHTSKS